MREYSGAFHKAGDASERGGRSSGCGHQAAVKGGGCDDFFTRISGAPKR